MTHGRSKCCPISRWLHRDVPFPLVATRRGPIFIGCCWTTSHFPLVARGRRPMFGSARAPPEGDSRTYRLRFWDNVPPSFPGCTGNDVPIPLVAKGHPISHWLQGDDVTFSIGCKGTTSNFALVARGRRPMFSSARAPPEGDSRTYRLRFLGPLPPPSTRGVTRGRTAFFFHPQVRHPQVTRGRTA